MKHLDIEVLGKMYDKYLDSNGNTYNIAELHDGTIALALNGWGFRDVEYTKLDTQDMEALLKCEYICETVTCEECGAQHDSNESTWTVIGKCDVVCLECRKAEDTLVDIITPEDIFKSKNTEDVDLTEYEEIECLFCDSSGFGQSFERALTRDQAIREADRILAEYPNEQLKAGISGIGQFQVCLSIYRKED